MHWIDPDYLPETSGVVAPKAGSRIVDARPAPAGRRGGNSEAAHPL